MRNIHLKYIAISILSVSVFFGCATIVSHSSYPININSNPKGASVSIKDRSGMTVYSGNTPAFLYLEAGDGFFSRAYYTLTLEKDDYATKTIPIQFKIDGWYIGGNILFGGLIGWLIVDPATGAMWKLENAFINETLNKPASSNASKLNIRNINEIPDNWKSKLVKISG